MGFGLAVVGLLDALAPADDTALEREPLEVAGAPEVGAVVAGDVAVGDADLALAWLELAPGVADAYLSGASLHAVIDRTGDEGPEHLRGRLVAAGFGDAEVEPVEASIEDVFVNLVTRQRSAAPGA